MNALLTASRGLQSLVGAPLWAVAMLKITVILATAWVAHGALWRCNPRWRVLLWRVTAVGLAALPVAVWLLPAFEIPVEKAQSADETNEAVLPGPSTGSTIGAARLESSIAVPGMLQRQDGPLPLVQSAPFAAPTMPAVEPEGAPIETAPSSSLPTLWRGLLAAAWSAGIAVLVFRWSIGCCQIGRLVRSAASPPDWIRGECRRVAQAVGCSAGVDVRESPVVQSPLLCGLFRPVLLLPLRMREDSYRHDLPAIFAHELTHVRFRDLAWNAALHVVSIVLWFHPLAWRLRRVHLSACELVCDGVSAEFVGSVGEYCRTLARVAVESVALASGAGIAMAGSSNVSRRLDTLRRKVFCAPLRRPAALAFGLGALLAIVVIGALQFAFAAQSESSADKDESGDSVVPAGIAVEGTVTTPDGKPAVAAAVGLFYGYQGSLFPRTKTDQNGRYRLAASKPGHFVGAHEPGKFTVAAAAGGFVPAWKTRAADKEQQTVDLQLIKGETARLRVVDQGGKPVAGAKITTVFDFYKDNCDALMLDYEQSDGNRSAYSGKTDDQGRWSRIWTPNDQIRLFVEKESYPDKHASLAADKQEHVVELAKANTLRVRVVDGAGKPLAGTVIKAAYLGHKDDYTTSAEGAATIAVPPPDGKFLSLIAYPAGYPPVRKWWKNDAGNELLPAEFTFAYEHGRTIGGTVRTERGKPIQGVKVHLSVSCGKYEQIGMCLALWDQVFLTDTKGRWRLDHVPQDIGEIHVGLEHPDYISAPGPGVVTAAEQRKIRDDTSVMVMKKGIPVFGTVTDPEGKPVADARVFLGEWYSPPRIVTKTNHEGHYLFASLAPSGTVLTAVKPGLAPRLCSVNVQSGIKPVDFQLEKGSTLRVKVVGRDGKPIPGVFVTPDTWRGKRVLCDLEMRGRTDAEGRWTWTWAPQDTVLTDFGLTGHVNYVSIRHRPLEAREAQYVVTLDPALTISGRVIDAETKQPVASFHIVRGSMLTGSVERIYWDRMEVRDGQNGRYEQMISQPSRVHLLRIEADGYLPAVSREFKDNEGNVTYDFSLTKGQNLNVLVQSTDGKPAAGAEICLCPEEPGKLINMAMFVKSGKFPYRDPSRTTLKTGPDGRVSIPPQGQRYLFVVLHDRGFAQDASEELAAAPTITLKAWARLEGTVLHGTKPVPGAKVDVYPTEAYDPKWGFLNSQEQTEADAQGKFVFAKLKPGQWRVRELPAEPSQIARPAGTEHEKSVKLAPGQTIHVTLGVAGRPDVGM